MSGLSPNWTDYRTELIPNTASGFIDTPASRTDFARVFVEIHLLFDGK